MAALRAGNLLGWPSPLVLWGSQDPAGCACIPPGEPPSQNQPNRIGWEGALGERNRSPGAAPDHPVGDIWPILAYLLAHPSSPVNI
jgi:hypothetical protein